MKRTILMMMLLLSLMSGWAKANTALPAEDTADPFFSSCWRNEQTGDWDIAFMENFVIYDCQFWDYINKPDLSKPVGKTSFTITHDGEAMEVKVSKEKDGKRTIQVGKQPAKLYSLLTENTLPEYPTKDTRTGFVDTDMQPGTVTVTGLIRNCPKGEEFFQLVAHDLFLGSYDLQMQYAPIDSLGRFTMSFPLVNSAKFGGSYCISQIVLEPGKRYFLLIDPNEESLYFMGDDVRLQNELCRFPMEYHDEMPYSENDDEVDDDNIDMDVYLASVDDSLKALYQSIDAFAAAHPSVSARYLKYRTAYEHSWQANLFYQDAPWVENKSESDQYAYDHFWTKMEKPYTLFEHYRNFWICYLGNKTAHLDNLMVMKMSDYVDEMVDNEEDKKILEDWFRECDEAEEPSEDEEETGVLYYSQSQPGPNGTYIQTDTNSETGETWATVIDETGYMISSDNPDFNVRAFQLMRSPKALPYSTMCNIVNEVETKVPVLDSLGIDDVIKDMIIVDIAYSEMSTDHSILLPKAVDYLRQKIKHPACLDRLLKLSEKIRGGEDPRRTLTQLTE